jgi:hypothetical protein
MSNLENPTPTHFTQNNTPGQPGNPFGIAILAFLLGEHAKGVDLAEIASHLSWLHILMFVVPLAAAVLIWTLKRSTHSLNAAAVWIENAWTVIGAFAAAIRRVGKAAIPPRFRSTPTIGPNEKVKTPKRKRGAKTTPSSRTSGSRRST